MNNNSDFRVFMRKRNDAIYKDYMAGMCVLDLADKYDISGYRIVQILRDNPKYGLEKARLNWQKGTQAKSARSKGIYEDCISGMPYSKIAEKWGTTIGAVRAVAKRYRKKLEKSQKGATLPPIKDARAEIIRNEKKRRLIAQARAIPNQSLSNLAKQYSLTPNEARNILREAGIIKCPRNDLSDEALWAGIGDSYDDIY